MPSSAGPQRNASGLGGDRGLVGDLGRKVEGFRNGGFVSRPHRIYIHEGGQRQSLMEFSPFEIGFPSRSYVAQALAYDNTHAGKRAKILLQNLAGEDQAAFDPLTIEGRVCHRWLCTPPLKCGSSSSSRSRRATAASWKLTTPNALRSGNMLASFPQVIVHCPIER